MAQAYGTLVSHRTGNAEALQAQTDFFGGFGSGFDTGFKSDGRTYGVGPNGVFKSDRLNAFDDFFYVNAFV